MSAGGESSSVSGESSTLVGNSDAVTDYWGGLPKRLEASREVRKAVNHMKGILDSVDHLSELNSEQARTPDHIARYTTSITVTGYDSAERTIPDPDTGQVFYEV